ncbi:hypothetical protein [Pleionea sediminis]|uniref:hypothetical protein n=1 Tax=Pleionea sediminis TaxID=2569479 RepID=UPI0011857AE5|nr:hypothetical protein [Pleionea sediminis]
MSPLAFLGRLPKSVGKREELCISVGGSPTWLQDLSCFTDQLFTGRKMPYYRYCSMTSVKSMSDSRALPRRVEQFSSKNSTKALLRFPTDLPHSIASSIKYKLSVLPLAGILKKENV